jgi:hypothetical protein
MSEVGVGLMILLPSGCWFGRAGDDCGSCRVDWPIRAAPFSARVGGQPTTAQTAPKSALALCMKQQLAQAPARDSQDVAILGGCISTACPIVAVDPRVSASPMRSIFARSRTLQSDGPQPTARSHGDSSCSPLNKPSKRPSSSKMEINKLTLSV